MDPMERFRQDVIGLASKAAGLGRKDAEAMLEKPPNPEMGDLALPCFTLARKFRKPPQDIAGEVSLRIKPKGLVRGAGAAGPYVNFFLDWERFSQLVVREILRGGDRYGSGRKVKERVMVEFAHPNTHKAFHIGHVRNISLGESLSRILEFSGTGVVRANYQGDIGPHVAKCLWGLINIHRGRAPAKERGKWLGRVYGEASRRFAASKKVQKEVEEINRMLYAGDRKIMPLWRKTRKWSLDYFSKIYRDFGARFDRLYFETEVEKPGKIISGKLLKKGLAKMSDGAIIMDLKKHGLGIWVLLTRDSISLYSAKDLALAELQVREYKPDLIIHVVGSEQTLHFRQLFKALELTRPSILKRERHLRYELVNLSSGKMKSREGKVILYEDLKAELYKLALKATMEKNPKLSKKESERTAMLVALGAMKYGMISQSPEKVIIFDWERVLDFQGNSAPYIQYTHARACSILRKAKAKPSRYDASLLVEDSEKALLRKLAEFPGEVSKAAADMRPHYIANYAYGLADLFNNLYQSLPVLKAESGTREARLALVTATRNVLKNALGLLGIEAPERM